MGRISSSIGLLSGIPIAETVEKLIALSAEPRDRLKAATDKLTQRQTAVTDLTARLLAVQSAARQLGDAAVFDKFTVASSRSAVTATAGTTAVPGQYVVTPLQLAARQQLLSSGFASNTDPIGAGTFTFGHTTRVDDGIDLSLLNGGEGFQRGSIKITDRSGATATIDLTKSRSVDDILTAINASDDIDVTAEVVGDGIRLTDSTGATTSNLRVQEVGVGETAASLGLDTINVAANQATGNDIVSLFNGVSLDRLNDGRGVRLNDNAADLVFHLRDGQTLQVDLNPTVGDDPAPTPTLGQVIERINTAGAGKVQAQLATSGDRIELKDLTTSSGNTFSVTNATGSNAASDLGLVRAAAGDTLTSDRLLGGLKSKLLRGLDGGQGQGLSGLGILQLTDRDGETDSVNLATAATLEDIVTQINAADTDIVAQINDARNGITLTDESGGTGPLIVANGDATKAAEKLNIDVNAAVSEIQSGDLRLAQVNENTLLSALNGGAGIRTGRIRIHDSQGATNSLNLADEEITTLGDVVDAINALAVQVTARINDRGDGIILIDDAGESLPIRVEDLSGNAAKDLHILGEGKTIDIAGEPTSVIDGSSTYQVTIDADDSLGDLVEKINDLDSGLTAAVVNDGSAAARYRIVFSSQVDGAAGAFRFDTSSAGFDVTETTAARDALLLFGNAEHPELGLLSSSATNQFSNLVQGLNINIVDADAKPVTLTVAATDSSLVPRVQTFVDTYNTLRDKLATYTSFNSDTFQTGLLFGSSEALRIDADLGRLLSGSFLGTGGSLQSLETIGLNLKDDGKLEFDETQLKQRFATDPEALKTLISTDDKGVADRLVSMIEKLVGIDDSVLVNRTVTIADQIDRNNDRIAFMNERLDRQRTLLFTDFARMEAAIAKAQDDLRALSGIQAIPPLGAG